MEYEKSDCGECGAVLVADQPFIYKDFKGYTSLPCACGSDESVCIATGRTKEMQSEMNYLFGITE